MSGTVPETVTAIAQSIDDDIGGLEDRLTGTVERLGGVLERVEHERTVVHGELEELNLERSLGLSGEVTADDEARFQRLLARDDDLASQYTTTSSLYRQLSGFVHLLTATRQQFRSDEELPGVEHAQRLAIRHAMIRAQEDERLRLAREIHDGPAQVLANAIIGLEFVGRALQVASPDGSQAALTEIERIKGSMREGLTEIRRFIFDLRPSMLSQRGLAATVEHYIQTYRHLYSGDVELVIPAELPRLLPDQEMTAFRVIQESLQNVHRHARATKTWVSIRPVTDGVSVQIRDNGQGFRSVTSSLGTRFGLAGMRERAEVIGAQLTIRSAPDEGTEVTLFIPLHNRALGPVREGGQQRTRPRRLL